MLTGNTILAKALRRHGMQHLFFIMGGPMIDCENACRNEGVSMIDTRHEQAAAMMATAYSRLLRRPGVCMAASGPGSTNLVTGVAHAYVDGAPVIAVGGSSPVHQYGLGAFQEIDQLSMFKPITVWAERCYDPRRIPELVAAAFRHALAGPPGPVYLDMPGDVLYAEVPDDQVHWVQPDPGQRPPAGDSQAIADVYKVLARAERPIVVAGSGVLWSGAAGELRSWVERARVPFYTTPQARGLIPEDHDLSFLNARSAAFREADCVVVIGTRLNYVIGYARPPRFSPDAKLIQVDINPAEIAKTRAADAAVVGDAGTVLKQLLAAADELAPDRYAGWVRHLAETNETKRRTADQRLGTDRRPIHPLRLCKEVREVMERDAVLSVDGQEILNYARQAIPVHSPGHSLNSGPFGTMGVGLPFGLGAKVAMPDKQVVVLHGDGSFGLNGLEVDTAVRHQLPVLCVISNNGGWTAADKFKAGRELGFSRYDEMAKAFGCYAEHVEVPEQIRPALERANKAVTDGQPAVLNVITDAGARAGTVTFADYST
ncbi:MAG: thiamine pyrophosphate-binding protein [Streptosporangiaceae bacterium]